jgi:hypothetical protein
MSAFRRSASGAIEGFPLYLVIVIIIAVVSIVIVMGMLNSVSPPKSIKEVLVTSPTAVTVKDGDGNGVFEPEQPFTVKVKVVDNNGDPIKGATVTITGNSVKTSTGGAPIGTTDSNGEVSLTSLTCQVVGSTSPLTIKAEKSGYGEKTTTLPVVKG